MSHSRTGIVATVAEQFDRIWAQYRSAWRLIPADQWRSGPVDRLIPARHVYHGIETVAYYCRNEQPGFAWGARLGGDWETLGPDALPSQEAVGEYLEETAAQVSAWLAGLGENGMLAPQDHFGWTGPNPLGRCLYVLRHCQHHLGELNAELIRRGLDPIEWR